MKLPVLSNSRTGGAAIARRFSGSVRGLWRTHTCPCASTDTADVLPSRHFAGSFSQPRSSANCGSPPSPMCGASFDAACPDTRRLVSHQTNAKTAVTTHIDAIRFIGFLLDGPILTWTYNKRNLPPHGWRPNRLNKGDS